MMTCLQDIGKDEKISKTKATSYVPSFVEPFKVYEEKKEEPTFQIYQDKLKTESSTVLRNTQETETIEVKQTTEVKVRVETEKAAIEVNPTVKSVERYRPVLREIEIKPEDHDVLPGESPMSLDRSLVLKSSEKEARTKREACKVTQTNFYDIDEYRADIYNYFRSVEVSTRLDI